MLDLQILAQGQHVALFDLPAVLGRSGAARELGDTIESLIAFMDDLGGDPDLEDSETGSAMVDASGRFFGECPPEQDEDREPDDDAKGDLSWAEWHTRGRHKLDGFGGELLSRDRYGNPFGEDDEDDDPDTSVEDDPRGFDPEEDMCLAGDDRVSSGSCTGAMLLCEDTGPGDADDAEESGDLELNGDEGDYSPGAPWE